MIVKVYNGQEIKFCCKPCIEKFEADQAKYLANLKWSPVPPGTTLTQRNLTEGAKSGGSPHFGLAHRLHDIQDTGIGQPGQVLVRYLRLKCHRLHGDGMLEGEPPGVEHEARRRDRLS